MTRPIPPEWVVDAPRIVEGMPSEVYHADPVRPEPALSAGLGNTLVTKTPLHAWCDSARLNPDHEPENRATFDIGRAAHALLTGEISEVVRIDADDWRTKAAKEARDEAYARGATPLLPHQHASVLRMVRAVREQLRETKLGDVFEAGVCEASFFWESGGVWNRCRPDSYIVRDGAEGGGIIYDLKTTAEPACPVAWTKRAYAYGIDLRAALYIDGARTLLGGEWKYRFIPIEKSEPHALSILELDADALAYGERKLAEARRLWRECLDASVWPAWPARVSIVSAPKWAEFDWQDRAERSAALRSLSPSGSILDGSIQWQAPMRAEGGRG